MSCHGLEVLSSNSGGVEHGVHGSYVKIILDLQKSNVSVINICNISNHHILLVDNWCYLQCDCGIIKNNLTFNSDTLYMAAYMSGNDFVL